MLMAARSRQQDAKVKEIKQSVVTFCQR